MSRIRHTAVAVAGVACVGLTGAAASVVMTNLDVDLPSSDVLDLAISPHYGADLPSVAVKTAQPGLTHAAQVALVLESTSAVRAAAPLFASWTDTADQPTTIAAPPTKASIGGTVKVDNYYVGAAVVPVRASVLGLNITTNLLHALPEIFFPQVAEPVDAGNTQIRYEVDAKHGGVTAVIVDPELEQTVDMSRKHAV